MRDKPAGFLNIADHHSSSSICIEARCLWANQHGDLYLLTPGEDTISKGSADQTLVVVRENQRVEFLEGRKNLPDQFSLGFRTEGIASFTVNANDVLVSCNNARLDSGQSLRISTDTFVPHFRASTTLFHTPPLPSSSST